MHTWVRAYECTSVCTNVCTYVRDPVRLWLRHLYQVELELLTAHISKPSDKFSLMIDIGPKFYSAIPPPMPMTYRNFLMLKTRVKVFVPGRT